MGENTCKGCNWQGISLQNLQTASKQTTQSKNGQKNNVAISPKKIYRHMKRCSKSLIIKECKSKLQWNITSHQSEWLSSKNPQTINPGEGVDKREPSHNVGRNVNWYRHYGEQYGGSSKN